jgi:hypothetical protein
VPLTLSWVGLAPPRGHLWHIGTADPEGWVLLAHRDATSALTGSPVNIGRFAALAEARLAAQLLDAAMAGAPVEVPATPWRLATDVGALTLRQESASVLLVIEMRSPGSGYLEIARMFRTPATSDSSPEDAALQLCACVLWRLAQLRCLRRDTSPLEPLAAGDLFSNG